MKTFSSQSSEIATDGELDGDVMLFNVDDSGIQLRLDVCIGPRGYPRGGEFILAYKPDIRPPMLGKYFCPTSDPSV